MKTIFSHIRIKVSQVVLILVFMLGAALAEMLIPTFLAEMIDLGVGKSDKEIITRYAIIMIIVAIIAGAANIAANRIAAYISTKVAADIRGAVFNQIQNFSAAEMDKFGTATLVSRSTSDVTKLQMFASYLLRFGLMAPLVAITGLILSSITGGKVSAVLTIAIPLLLIVCVAIVAIIIRLSNKLRAKVDDLNLLFLETLEGVRVIRAFNKQEHETKRFEVVNKELEKLYNASGKADGTLVPAIDIIFGITNAAVLSLGAYYVYNKELEVGALIANSQYISMILYAVMLFTLVLIVMPIAHTCAVRIAEVLNTDCSLKNGEAKLEDRKLKGTVEFKDVTFAYPGASEPVIKNVSFSVHPGEFLAIIGRTGSGKSSLVKLIPRIYDATFGQILVDGINVKDYNQEDLRSFIGYVPQKNVLFTGDIASNLNFGNEEGLEADWKEAADIACASEFIDGKDGTYHSPISQGGTNLSGGQRQRMAIARAVMKKPEIYIFDDSFSALDVKTDKQLRTNIREKCGDAAVIMVAQRISSVTDANRILVLDHNEIVGDGTHKELLKNCSLYREIAELQMGKEAVEREEA